MQPVDISGFTGQNIATDPRLLVESIGVSAVDLEPASGRFKPLKQRLTVATVPANRKSLYRMGRDALSDTQYWLSASNPTQYAPGFGTDATERTFITGDSAPRWTSNAIGLTGPGPYPSATRPLGLPAPDTAPAVAITTAGTGTEGNVYYIETFVNDLGWESAPSPPSAGLFMAPGAIVAITLTATPPSGNYAFASRRVYRTQVDSTDSAEFYFLREVPISTTSTTDDARKLDVSILKTQGWLTPPDDGHSILALWNSMHAMMSGKTVHVCEAGYPYAYPLRYDRELPATGVALAKWGQNLLALTTGTPVLLQGQDPASLVDQPLPFAQPCASARGVVSFAHGVAWPSNEGLAYFGATGARMVTDGIITPDQWKAMDPSTMVAGRWRQWFVCSYGTGASRRGFMIDPLATDGVVHMLSAGFDACYYDEMANALFIADGTGLQKFGASSSSHTATFVSKLFKRPAPGNYGFAKVVASSYPVSLKVRAFTEAPDGTRSARVETRVVTSERAFTLQGGFSADEWQIEVSGASEIQLVRLADDIRQMRGF